MNLKIKPKFDKLILNAFYISVITLGLLLLVEIGAGIYLLYNTAPIKVAGVDSAAYAYFDWRKRYFEDRRRPGGAFQYEPFSVWSHTDRQSSLINVQNGYRKTWEPEISTDRKDFLIFMFGGSTTYCIESPDDLTIASILARQLNESQSEYRFVVRNYGVSAFISDQEVHLLTRLLGKGERPDAVVFYDGLNDIQIKAGLGREHFYDLAFQRQLYGKSNWRTRLQRLSNRSHLVALLTDRPSILHTLFPFITDREQLRGNAESMLSEYAENVRTVKALGREYSFRSLHFWQPSLFNTGKILTADEMLRDALSADLYDANQLVHEIVAQLIAEKKFFDHTGVIDISQAFDNVEETIFVDSNHVSPIGNAAVVKQIAPRIFGEIKRQ